MIIPFNKIYISGNEIKYEAFLMASCTSALESAAALLNIKEGDEIILPSFTFVSTANAFALRGANLVFCDSELSSPNIDADKIESLITSKTKAIVIIHYAGVACEMDKILGICKDHKLFLIEDAAHAIDSYYKNKPLGSFGNFGTFSFHETKNITAGECGLMTINDPNFVKPAEIMRDKGTNRTAFFRGEVNKYEWVGLGSSYAPSEILASFLLAQIENLDIIQNKRKQLWEQYYKILKSLDSQGLIKLPVIPDYAVNNAHIFYFLCKDIDERTNLIKFLKDNGIASSFHYLALHKSPYYTSINNNIHLPNAEMYTDCLIRLPMFFELKFDEIIYITEKVNEFYNN